MIANIRTRLPFRDFLFLVLVPAALLGLAACSSDDGDGPLPESTWSEDCPRCGIEWLVTLSEGEGNGQVEVLVTNTGERGRLRLRPNQLLAYALDQKQADSWREKYPQARAERDAVDQLVANGATKVVLRPYSPESTNVTIAPSQRYGGRFVPAEGRIPANTVGFVLFFGPVDHEITPAGLAETDHWATWDPTRPFFTVGRSEVRVQPIATAPAAPPARP